jgi:diguanylate cyclase (GGDEF)-like protein/PAS domain S-box-containing protein
VVFVAALIAALGLWQNARHATELQLEAEFHAHLRETATRIEQRMAAYQQVLHGVRGLFGSVRNVGRAEFRTYIAALHLDRQYPGIQGVGYANIVNGALQAGHVAAMRQEGFPEYAVFPPNARAVLVPIIYIEPFTGLNLRGFGFDPYTEPVRRAAMEQARDRDEARISGKVRLVLENEHGAQAGFVMYLPIYANGFTGATVELRREAIRGWVFAPFRMDDLMAGLGGERSSEFYLEVYDGETRSGDTRMYDGAVDQAGSGAHASKFAATRRVDIAGRPWTLALRSGPPFEARIDEGKAQAVLMGGLAVSLLLGMLTWLLATGRQRALALATAMTGELRESEQRWRFALDGAGDGVWDWNIQSGDIFVSRRWREIYGVADNREVMTFDEWQTYVHRDDAPRVIQALQVFLGGASESFTDEHRVICRDGSPKWVLSRGMLVSRDPDGKPLRMIGTHSDITARKHADDRQRLAVRVFETMGEAVMVTDTAARIVAINAAFARITGYDESEVLGHTPNLLSSNRHGRAFFEAMWHGLLTDGAWAGEIWNRRRSGEMFPEWQVISSVRDEGGRVTHYVSVFSDLTEIRRAQAEAEQRSWRDALTGLPNRALFLRLLEQTIANAYREDRFADVLLLDLDRFKDINEARGIVIGDALLKAVSQRLADALRTEDVLARLDSDEFAVLLPRLASARDVAGREALSVAEKLRTALREAIELDGEVFHLDVSIGVALFPESPQETAADVLRQADTAMHLAKAEGGARTVFFEAAMGESIRERYLLERELRWGIADGQLRLYLQPQVDTAGRQVGAEALVRWQHPERGLVPPGIFIPLAESSNLIVDIDRWMLGEVCRLLAQLDGEGYSLRISVNVSPRHFQACDFVDEVKRCLAASGADPAYLVLEVTEGLVIGNFADVVAKMSTLTALGIHFSMDDFGTGYSSLSYLKRLPFHELKIDKSFIQDAPVDPNDAALVDVILSVARHLNLQVVAEGVETQAQADFLNARGQIIHQGYLYGRPEACTAWLAALRRMPSAAAERL